MDQIIEINRRTVFALEEAQVLLPVIYRITKQYSTKVDALLAKLDVVSGYGEQLNDSRTTALEVQINALIQEWQSKVQRLGALPKGLWIADFDSGDGYYCWKFPERGIEYWHRYNDGLSKRVPIAERRRLSSLDDQILQRRERHTLSYIANVSAFSRSSLQSGELTE